MLGAITGNIVGSVYELNNIKHKNFEPLFSPRTFFTSGTILTVALMDAILNDQDYGDMLRWYYNEYYDYDFIPYGARFRWWCMSEDKEGYNSWGNGSAMRTSAVGYAFDSLEEVLEKAAYYASFTHNHPEGIKGAQATSVAIFLARTGSKKEDIRSYISKQFGYDLNRTINDIRPDYIYDESCQGTVPEAIVAFLDSTDYEDAIRCAVSLGGDIDTLTCITGGIAEAFYGDIPQEIADQSMHTLVPDLREVVVKFYNKYRPSDTITSAYKNAGKFVKELNKIDDHFQENQENQENQDKFWKSVVRESKQSRPLNFWITGYGLLWNLIILIVLLSLGVPQYQGYIQSSKESVAKNSLRSIGLVEADYFSENNQYLTTGVETTANININLFLGKKTLDEQGDYNYFIKSYSGGYIAYAYPKNRSSSLEEYCIDYTDGPPISCSTPLFLTNKEKDEKKKLQHKNYTKQKLQHPFAAIKAEGFKNLEDLGFIEDSGKDISSEDTTSFRLLNDSDNEIEGFKNILDQITYLNEDIDTGFNKVIDDSGKDTASEDTTSFRLLNDSDNEIEDFKSLENLSAILDRIGDAIHNKRRYLISFLLISLVFFVISSHFMYRRLSSYLKKLSSGVRIKPPKFILKEYSEISQAVYELQRESLSKKYIEVHSDKVVHDIKNLNIGISKGVNGLVEICKERNSEFLDIKEELIESSNRMQLLMMQLIEISKLEKTVLKISKISIDNVLEEILNDIKIIHALKNKNIQVNININSNIYIEAEKDLIETCLKSAINNAIDFTLLDLNNIKEITFEAVESQDDFIIRIHDQGVGIPEEIIDKVNGSDTEYISMPRPDTKSRSTGLGFKISLKIMSLHGGSVVIRNRRDTQGAVVTFTIPKKANNY